MEMCQQLILVLNSGKALCLTSTIGYCNSFEQNVTAVDRKVNKVPWLLKKSMH